MNTKFFILQCILVSLALVRTFWSTGNLLFKQLLANDCDSMDQASVQITHPTSNIEYQTSVLYQYKECKSCQMLVLAQLTGGPAKTGTIVKLSTNYAYDVLTRTINSTNSELISECKDVALNLGECGQYQLGK